MTMWALADCNSFFCSVEKVFHPGLEGKPVCVLSSNDGNIVALTPEAKALGLRRGDPVFKVRDIIERGGVRLFSTNMMLYAAMSRRVTSILRKSIHHVENYSIDESFCCLDGYERLYDVEELMRGVVEKIRLWTDIPVSVGIAPSKTLAKMGSKFAKQYKGYRSVCLIDTEEKRRKALELFDLADVWGIGRGTLEKLNYYGIRTPLEFADKSEGWVRSRFTLPTVRTWMELNGKDCIDTTEVLAKQTICTSRSFGQMVTEFSELKASVASFASSCANKLRGQRSLCRSVTVFITSNRFRDDLPQYGNAQTITLPIATADTLEITKAAIEALEAIYQQGIHYKKSGVILGDITSDRIVEQSLFDNIKNRPERHQLMHSIDNINQRYCTKTILLGVEGIGRQSWTTKCEQRTPNYLTDIRELMTIEIYGLRSTFTPDNVFNIYKKFANDTLYMPVEKMSFLSFAVTPEEYVSIADSIQKANDRESELWNIARRASYNYSKDRWGKRVADVIRQGNVEFGFTPAMVCEAKSGRSYRCYRERTPLGYATVYDFYEDGDRFFFINKKLVGVQWNGERVRYRR